MLEWLTVSTLVVMKVRLLAKKLVELMGLLWDALQVAK